eukprot:Hpha_TRINITY_DN28635_c0_g1::TRINITY_DN28635_c0_g1_i1::g.156376::m.156376
MECESCRGCGLWEALYKRIESPTDTPEQRRNRRILLPCWIGACLLTFVINLGQYPVDQSGDIGFMLEFVAFTAALCLCLHPRVDPADTMKLAVVVGCVGNFLVDLGQASMLQIRGWANIVLALDGCLSVDLPQWVASVVVGITVLFLAVERLEATYRFGLYEWAHMGEHPEVDVCDCPHPPCGLRADFAMINWIFMCTIFL